ncbi:hypothetical protein [Nostoc sp.]|uniref:hypothetical protein n=1 Tax=Nostoc sp. TaxID=1180 RepID=UPI002FF9F05B
MSSDINLRQVCAMHPDCSSGIGVFSWRRMKLYTMALGDEEAFEYAYVVCVAGYFQTKEDGRISSITPIKYLFNKDEAVDLANQLNGILGKVYRQ